MHTVETVFAILFVYLISVKGGAIPEISDSNGNENRTRTKAICRVNADCYEVEKCVLEEINGQGSCVCRAGRSGDKCQIVDDCVTGKYSRCKDGKGRCSYNYEKEKAECDCEGAKKWDNILKICRNTCDNEGCANKGVCEDAVDGERFCTCKKGTRGDFCEIVVDCELRKSGEMLCGSGGGVKCVYDESKMEGKCLCDNSTKLFHYDNKRCKVPCNDDCQNSGTCEKVRDYRFCNCKPDTRGDFCERVDDCIYEEINCGKKTDVKCVYDAEKEKATCKCDDPKKIFNFRIQECRNSCSTNEDCRSFEKCKELGGSGDKACDCSPGKSGELCETIIECMTTFKSCIGDNGKCFYNETIERAECDCGVGKEFKYNEKRCQTLCDDNCVNDGVCKSVSMWPNIKFCICKSGTSGDFCENVRDCDICGSDTDVQCIYDYRIKGGKCVCDNTTKSFDYHEGKCRVPCKDDCHNNGKCEYVRGFKFCSCLDGTSGDFCETVVDCTHFCGTKSDVKCVYDKTGEIPTCKCINQSKSFDYDAKECRIPCNNNCANGGVCKRDISGVNICECKPGTSGAICQIVTECIEGFCGEKNDVTCVYDGKAGSLCNCKDAKKLFMKAIHECRIPCTNDTGCETYQKCIGETGIETFCGCPPGKSGETCEIIDDCEAGGKYKDCKGNNGKCVYNPTAGSAVCDCGPRRKWDSAQHQCRVPCNDNCVNDGVCKEDVSGVKFCECKPGTSGAACKVVKGCIDENFEDLCGIKKDVKCIYDGKAGGICKCDDTKKQFVKALQECRIPCNNNCVNGGVCKEDSSGVNFCECKPGTSGAICQIVTECIEGLCGEKNDVTCVYDGKAGGLCSCKDANKHFMKTLQECRIPCNINCANGGVCKEDVGGVKFCECKPGTSGTICQKVNDCSDEDFCGNKEDVKCTYDGNKGGLCMCDDTKKQFVKTIKECRIPCKDDQGCEIYQKCIGEIDKETFCGCPSGKSGETCKIIDDCEKDGKYKDCHGNNGKCEYNATVESAFCDCGTRRKWDGVRNRCRIPCKDDCHNNGKCEYVGGFKFCFCEQGTSGDLCDILDGCSTNFCGKKSDVKCVYDTMEKIATCRCDDPYKSFDSDAKECRSPCANSPCKNGGTCEVKGNNYNCICWGNFYGKSCELENRSMSSSVLALLALITLFLFILTCIGCFQLKMNQKLNTGFQKFGVYKPSPGEQ